MSNIVEFLKTAEWFMHYTPAELAVWEKTLELRVFMAGDEIYKEGQPGASCFFVMGGKVALEKIVRKKAERLCEFGPGSVFGLVGLVDGGRRSESCVAIESSTILELKRAEFDRLFRSASSLAYKFQVKVVKALARQLRTANEKLASLHKGAPGPKASEPPPEQHAELIRILGQSNSSVMMHDGDEINLDEVEHVIPDGQARPAARPPKP